MPCLQQGKHLVAAGYALYSSATTLVLSWGEGVHGFTLDRGTGEFVLTHPAMMIPARGDSLHSCLSLRCHMARCSCQRPA